MDERFRRYRSDRDLRQCGVYEGTGKYRSRWYQGVEAGMEWHRLSLDGNLPLRVQVYTTDAPPGEWNGTAEPVLERDACDLLLSGVRGRYLCFTVFPSEGLRGFSLSFPGHSVDSRLPGVMRGDPTLRRFLGVYESVYMDTNQILAQFPGRLDPHADHPLPELRYWLGAVEWMRGTPCVPDLLAAAVQLNRLRGTRCGLDLLVRLVTGGRGELVEHFQWQNRAMGAQEQADCARLYGREPSRVTLLLPPQTSEAALRFLERILEDFIPMGVSYSVLVLQAGAPMDGHSYLDVNAQLCEPPPAALDESDLDELTLE